MEEVNLLDLLRFKTLKGFREFGYPLTKEYTDRIEYELGIIQQCGFAPYFLIVADLCRFMRERGIRFIARGSGCGSAVVWGIGISHRWLDPVKYNIPFERFLNPQRISNPDIDIDIQDDRREEVFQYTVDKYGADRVAKIITFGTLGAKSSIIDIARALDIPDYQKVAAEISSAIPGGKGEDGKNWRLEDVIKGSEFLRDKEKQWPELFKFAKRCEGKIRNAGIHAAGTIIAPDVLTKFLPLYYDPKKKGDSDAFAATQWDMYDCEDRGLLKMDYLGLKTLRVIDETVKMINAMRQMQGLPADFDIDNIPQDDEKTWNLLASGKLSGIFQVERTFVQNFAKRMNLNQVRDPWQLAVLVAIIRPGMMDSGNTEVYLRRASGQEAATAPHPLLDQTFPRTYGLMCFQEDVMATCVDFSGFTRSEADVIRKGVGKKDRKFIDKQQPLFFEGGMQPRVELTIHPKDGEPKTFVTKPRNPDLKAALEAVGASIDVKGKVTDPNGCVFNARVVMAGATREECEYIWGLIEAHSRYSFNNAHAAAYGMVVSYQTAYLKANYTLPFMCSLINSEAGSSSKEDGYNYKVAEYVEEARSMAVKVLPPCVRNSAGLCKINPYQNTIRFGLSLIKKVSTGSVEWIRQHTKNATTLKEAVLMGFSHEQRDGTTWKSYSQVGKGDLEALCIAGALDSFGMDRPTMQAMIPELLERSSKWHEQACKVKNGKNVRLKPEEVKQGIDNYMVDEGGIEDVTLETLLEKERDYTGCFLSQSPFEPYRQFISQWATCTPGDILAGEVGGAMVFPALLSSARPIVIKNGKNKGQEMAFMNFKGVNGDIEATAFNQIWEKYTKAPGTKGFIERGKVYLVNVKPDRNGRGYNLEHLTRLSNCGYTTV